MIDPSVPQSRLENLAQRHDLLVHGVIWLATRRTENECIGIGSLCWQGLSVDFQSLKQSIRYRHLTLFVCLRRPIELRFPTHINGVRFEMHILPRHVHCFLLSKACHQQEVIKRSMIERAF
jgi:hypothetical protein